jgi:hypothetical protein
MSSVSLAISDDGDFVVCTYLACVCDEDGFFHFSKLKKKTLFIEILLYSTPPRFHQNVLFLFSFISSVARKLKNSLQKYSHTRQSWRSKKKI